MSRPQLFTTRFRKLWESAGRLVEICRLLRDRKGRERQRLDHEAFR
jgi:hypothetical protein